MLTPALVEYLVRTHASGTALERQNNLRVCFLREIFDKWSYRRLNRIWLHWKKHHGGSTDDDKSFLAPLRDVQWWPTVQAGPDFRGALTADKGDSNEALAEVAEILFSVPCMQILKSDLYVDKEMVAAWGYSVITLAWGFGIGSEHLAECKWAILNMCWGRIVVDCTNLYQKEEDRTCELEFNEGEDKDLALVWKNYKAPSYGTPTLKNKQRNGCCHMFYMAVMELQAVLVRVIRTVSHPDSHTASPVWYTRRKGV